MPLRPPERLSRTFWLLAALALWLLATPYVGIDHDARLYVLQALRRLEPGAYDRDLWFAFGSQDDLSLFSPLLAPLLAALGINDGARWATLLTAAVFVAAAAALCRALLRGPAAWLALLMVVSVPLCYSARDLFHVREGFITARGSAEALSLLGMAWALRRRWMGAVAAHGLAAALHPIMALGPVGVSLLLAAGPRRRDPLLLVGVAVAAAILAAGPMLGLPVMDGRWLDIVGGSRIIFVEPWLRQNPAFPIGLVALLVLGMRLGSRRARPVYRAVALVGLVAVGLSLVAGRWPLAIALQAQFWRALWLVHVLAIVAAVDMLVRAVLRRRAPWRLPVIFVVLACTGLGDQAGWPLAVLALAVTLGAAPVLAMMATRLQGYRSELIFGCVALALLQVPGFILTLGLSGTVAGAPDPLHDLLLGLLRSGGYGLLAWILWRILARLRPTAGAAAVITVFLLAMMLWDQRSEVLRLREAGYGVPPRPFAGTVERGAIVYWRGSPERVWFELGTASYASVVQSSGQVFSAERVSLLERRMTRILVSSLPEAKRRAAEAGAWTVAGAVRAEDADLSGFDANSVFSYEFSSRGLLDPSYLCGDPELDYVVGSPQAGGPLQARFAERLPGGAIVEHALYSCRMLRESAAARGSR